VNATAILYPVIALALWIWIDGVVWRGQAAEGVGVEDAEWRCMIAATMAPTPITSATRPMKWPTKGTCAAEEITSIASTAAPTRHAVCDATSD